MITTFLVPGRDAAKHVVLLSLSTRSVAACMWTEDSPEKRGWALHVVRANVVQGQFCSPIFSGLLRENTRVFKLSNNLAELVALVHALEFVLSVFRSLPHDLSRLKVCCARGAAELAGEQPLGSGPLCWRTSQVL